MVNVIQPGLEGFLPGTDGNDAFVAESAGINKAIITTFAGDDSVIAISNRPDSEDEIGIANSLIDTGDGADVIVAGAPPNPDSTTDSTIGIAGGAIIAGAGNDTLIARGTVGVVNAAIDAGPGDDLLDLQSGTGVLNGGDGFDTLVLEGNSSDFNLQLVPDNAGILVTGSNTELLTNGIEGYQFDDLTIPVEDIV